MNNGNFANSNGYVNAINAGTITPASLLAAMKQDSDFIRSRALAGGWTAAQIV
jgi:hypothetical protein